MKLVLYTIILPRLETTFLDEWIQHYLMLGVDEIYIYNNGFVSYDVSLCKHGTRLLDDNEKKTKWEKKPDMDYLEECSDDEVSQMLEDIVNKYPEVTLVSWKYGIDHEISFPECQRRGFKQVNETIESDWYLQIDPDEFVYLEKHRNLKDVILDYDDDSTGGLVISQRIFDKRTRGQAVRKITDWCFDTHQNQKTILKGQCESDTPAIHLPLPKSGELKLLPFEEVRFNHYRGNPASAGGSVYRKDEYLNQKIQFKDESMFKMLDSTLNIETPQPFFPNPDEEKDVQARALNSITGYVPPSFQTQTFVTDLSPVIINDMDYQYRLWKRMGVDIIKDVNIVVALSRVKHLVDEAFELLTTRHQTREVRIHTNKRILCALSWLIFVAIKRKIKQVPRNMKLDMQNLKRVNNAK